MTVIVAVNVVITVLCFLPLSHCIFGGAAPHPMRTKLYSSSHLKVFCRVSAHTAMRSTILNSVCPSVCRSRAGVPRAWNSLPSCVRAAASLISCRRELKTPGEPCRPLSVLGWVCHLLRYLSVYLECPAAYSRQCRSNQYIFGRTNAIGPLFCLSVCLFCPACDVDVLWPNGWMD